MNPNELKPAEIVPTAPIVNWEKMAQDALKQVKDLETAKGKLEAANKQLNVNNEKLKDQLAEQANRIAELEKQPAPKETPAPKVVVMTELPEIGSKGQFINHAGHAEEATVIGHGINSVHLDIQGANSADRYKKNNVKIGDGTEKSTFSQKWD